MAAQMDVLFKKMAEIGASDLHLSVSVPPMVRKDGRIKELEPGGAVLTADVMRALLTSIMPAKNQEEFAARNDTDFAYEIRDLARFRCNVFMDRKGMGSGVSHHPVEDPHSRTTRPIESHNGPLLTLEGPRGRDRADWFWQIDNALRDGRFDQQKS